MVNGKLSIRGRACDPEVGRLELMRRVTQILVAALLSGAPGAVLAECPAALARDLAGEAPDCALVAEDVLRSALGNGEVVYRLYRWVSTREEAPSALYDVPPYNQTAVTLSLAERPDDPPFWSSWYWLGLAWFEAPYLARQAKWGEFLVVPGRYTGTGSFIEDRVFMPDHGRGWTEIRAAAYDQETGDGWLSQLKAYLPPGHGVWKGILVDYATLTGTTAVWRDGDANCCPSGGEISFRLKVDQPGPGLVVDAAEYRPPDQGATSRVR